MQCKHHNKFHPTEPSLHFYVRSLLMTMLIYLTRDKMQTGQEFHSAMTLATMSQTTSMLPVCRHIDLLGVPDSYRYWRPSHTWSTECKSDNHAFACISVWTEDTAACMHLMSFIFNQVRSDSPFCPLFGALTSLRTWSNVSHRCDVVAAIQIVQTSNMILEADSDAICWRLSSQFSCGWVRYNCDCIS